MQEWPLTMALTVVIEMDFHNMLSAIYRQRNWYLVAKIGHVPVHLYIMGIICLWDSDTQYVFFVFLEKKMNIIFLHSSLFLIIIIKIIKLIINLFFAYLKKKGKIKNVVILRNAVAFCDEQPEI